MTHDIDDLDRHCLDTFGMTFDEYLAAPERSEPDGQTRKISDNQNDLNRPQTRVSNGVSASGNSATPLSPLSSLSTPSTRHLSKPSTSIPTKELVPANTNLKAWRSLDERARETYTLTEAEKSGARSFRLTFSPAKEKHLRAAAASGRDIRQMIADAIAFQFRKRFKTVPGLWFAIEEAPGTCKLHIHGIYLPDRPLPADAIRDAFLSAAGKITGQAGSTQFWHDEGFTLDRYASYSRKAEQTVRKRLGIPSVTFLNDRLKRVGRGAYDKARKPAPVTPDPILTDDELDELIASL